MDQVDLPFPEGRLGLHWKHVSFEYNFNTDTKSLTLSAFQFLTLTLFIYQKTVHQISHQPLSTKTIDFPMIPLYKFRRKAINYLRIWPNLWSSDWLAIISFPFSSSEWFSELEVVFTGSYWYVDMVLASSLEKTRSDIHFLIHSQKNYQEHHFPFQNSIHTNFHCQIRHYIILLSNIFFTKTFATFANILQWNCV